MGQLFAHAAMGNSSADGVVVKEATAGQGDDEDEQGGKVLISVVVPLWYGVESTVKQYSTLHVKPFPPPEIRGIN